MPTLDELKLLGDGIRETTSSTPGWDYIFVSSMMVVLLLAMEFVQITAIIFLLIIMGLAGNIGLLLPQLVLQPGEFT